MRDARDTDLQPRHLRSRPSQPLPRHRPCPGRGTTRTLSVLIISGSPIIGTFDFRARVDFVRVPGVVKLRNGEYTSLNLLSTSSRRCEMRSSIIHHTADIFDPDLFIVDKEPLGLRGEVENDAADAEGARHAAGPGPARRHGRSRPAGAGMGAQERRAGACAISTTRSGSMACRRSASRWTGIELPQSVRQQDDLHRLSAPRPAAAYRRCRRRRCRRSTGPIILVTTGGGGDGEAIDRLGAARPTRTTRPCPYRALIVFGPFMQSERADGLHEARREAEEGRSASPSTPISRP